MRFALSIELALATGCALALMSCSSNVREPQVHRVAIRAMQYDPATLEVDVGDVIVWTNEDVVPHTVTSAGTFDSQSLSTKQDWRLVATTAGERRYGCTFHPTMKGVLVVR